MASKEKGVLIQLLVDAAEASPANGDERKLAEYLVETVTVKTGEQGRPPKKIKKIAADKGYDSRKLREFLFADSKKEECRTKTGTGKVGADACAKISN